MTDSQVLQSALFKTELFSECLHSGSISQDPVTKSEARDHSKDYTPCRGCSENCISSPYRFQLEKDVEKLQQQLKEEMQLHAILERAIEKDPGELSCSSDLPDTAHELLTNIAKLEATISSLENETILLHFQLTQERNERRLAEYRLRHSPTASCSEHTSYVLHHSLENDSCQEPKNKPSESTSEYCMTNIALENPLDLASHCHKKKVPGKADYGGFQSVCSRNLLRRMPSKGLWDHPNILSEEMVRCMKNIFMSLAKSAVPSKSSESHLSPISPIGHLSNSSSRWSPSERSMISSWVQSPQIDIPNNSDILATENACDPYKVKGKLSWAEVGIYGSATEVSWMSVGKKQLQYASGALRRFRTLVEQLARVNPIHLSCDEKISFWINLYNALIMHAYLAYGVPRSDMKLFSLMQKAAYTVGGHSYTAAAIEYVILKMKPPHHRPQIALLLAIHKLKVSEEQRKAAIDTHEPLIAFALSCGMYSSPAVRIYRAKSVREELEEAQRDFIQASVGLSIRGKLLVPKMLHSFAKSFVDDSRLSLWVSRYLPPHQAAFVEQCISRRRQSLLASRNCGILPFDSRFRYLFLPDKILVRD